jgi:hypothetical protein
MPRIRRGRNIRAAIAAVAQLASLLGIPALAGGKSYEEGLSEARSLPRSYDHIRLEHGPAAVHVSSGEITGTVTVGAKGLEYVASNDRLALPAARLQSVEPGSGSRLTLTYLDGSTVKKLTLADTRPKPGSSSNGYRSDRIVYPMTSIRTLIDSKSAASD